MTIRITTGDCLQLLRSLAAESVHCCVTSPPYFGLRDYGVDGQIGREESPSAFVRKLVQVFRLVRDALRSDGTLWLNLGDSYASEGGIQDARDCPEIKAKDLLGMPWRVAFALQEDGWYLRSDIIWAKPNPMPESVRDRPTKAHEYLFLLSKGPSYYYDADAIREEFDTADRIGMRRSYRAGSTSNHRLDGGHEAMPGSFVGLPLNPLGRNKRSVWTVASEWCPGAHFATFPPALIDPCIRAGSPEGGMVLDPFGGAGTTGLVADRLRRNAVLIEINPAYAEFARRRILDDAPLFATLAHPIADTSPNPAAPAK